MGNKTPNLLINEKSPYLLQHAYNPVDWHPWAPESFEKAKREDKPVFLSIGYSTCHWCHVMERESFSDVETAKLLNEAFVCVKVDREERPDIDDVYMKVCQLMTGSGGWPLTIIMTPDTHPFFAATYLPRESQFGRIGLKELASKIRKFWKSNRRLLVSSAAEAVELLKKIEVKPRGERLDESVLDSTFETLSDLYDDTLGGFGSAPKFPTPHNLTFLLRYSKRSGNSRATRMVEETLQAMRRGGLFDQVGFGFHRYSTDGSWLVPHFEKMLYDQALLVNAYVEAFQATGKEVYKETACEVISYVLRDMSSTEGGFYSAEDADSEGEEGKFYLWTEDEIRKHLPPEEAALTLETYGVKRHGNFRSEAVGHEDGRNILHLKKPLTKMASNLKLPLKLVRKRLESSRRKLFKAREKRVHPSKDDKILTDWNGLMIATLAKAARVFKDENYVEAAEKAVGFLVNEMMDEEGGLYHRYRDGEAAVHGFLDDYAFLVWGLLELYETTFKSVYLKHAETLALKMIECFWDEEDGGFHFTPSGSEQVLARRKKVYDGALPSGNSVAVLNLFKLALYTGKTSFKDYAWKTISFFSSNVYEAPHQHTHFLTALHTAFGPTFTIVVVGAENSEDTQTLLQAIRTSFAPNKVVVYKRPGEEALTSTGLPETPKHEGGNAAAYVCGDDRCYPPETSAENLSKTLEKM